MKITARVAFYMAKNRAEGVCQMKDFLVMENITKVYDNGIMANDNVCFSAKKGEIHAICGENGAGKSTLMKLLFGVEQPNQGRIIIRGQEVKLTSPMKAIEMGISTLRPENPAARPTGALRRALRNGCKWR